MKSDVIKINSRKKGFQDALRETEHAGQYRNLSPKEMLQLQLCTEEMLSLVRSVTGEIEATFWLESEGKQFDLHVSTQTVMDREKRNNLIASATSRTNEAANTFLGKLRDSFEAALVSQPNNSIPDDVLDDLANRDIEEEPGWDQYEQAVLRKVADQVKISIKGGMVDLTVSKRFE